LIGLPVIAQDNTLRADFEKNNDDGQLLKSRGGSNVFFSAYGCFVISLLVITNWFRANQTTTYWVLLSGFSFNFMVSSLFNLNRMVSVEGEDGSTSEMPLCFEDGGDGFCDRVYFAVVLGASSTVVSVLMTLLFRAPVVLHLVAGLTIFGAWCAGVARITFGDEQRKTVSTVFFGTWFALFASLNIATTSIVLMVKERIRRRKKPIEERTQTTGGQTSGVGGGDATQDHAGLENERQTLSEDEFLLDPQPIQIVQA
jgi:hypothetical protein